MIRSAIRSTDGFKSQSNNCTMVALAQVSDIPHETIERACYKHGYKPSNGMPNLAVMKAATEVGIQFETIPLPVKYIPGRKQMKRMTVGEVRKKYNDGVYLLFVRGHVLSLVYGDIVDPNFSTYGIKRRVNNLYRVTNSPVKPKPPALHTAEFIGWESRIAFKTLYWKSAQKGSDNFKRMGIISQVAKESEARGDGKGALVREVILRSNGFVSLTFMRNLVKRGICGKVS